MSRRRKCWTRRATDRLRELASLGLSDREIGRVLRRSRAAVERKRFRLRIPAPGYHRPWTRHEEQQAINLDAQGKTAAAIGVLIGRSRSGVRLRLWSLKRRLGIVNRINYRERGRGELSATVRRMCLPGVPDSAVANVLGVHRWTVGKTRKRLGIPPGVSSGGTCVPRVPVPPEGERLSWFDLKVAVILYGAANHGIGMGDSEIARLTGHSRGSVWMCRKELIHGKKRKPGAELVA